MRTVYVLEFPSEVIFVLGANVPQHLIPKGVPRADKKTYLVIDNEWSHCYLSGVGSENYSLGENITPESIFRTLFSLSNITDFHLT